MSERFQTPEYRSATPQEIREDLGLPEDATQGEVVAERWRQFKASERASEADQFAEGDTDA